MITYKQYDAVVSEDFAKDFGKEAAWTAAKILDPTGVLSWADLARAAMHMGQDFGPGSVTLFILALFAALPNFGVLAGGVGAIPWAAAKAAARGAAKNPKLLAKAGEKVLLALSKTPGAPAAAEKLLAKLESQGVINATQKTLVSNSVKQGKLTLSGVRNKDLGIAAPKGSNATSFAKNTPKNIEKAFSGLSKTDKLTSAAAKSAVSKYGIAQLGARAVPRIGDVYNYTTGKINNWAKDQTSGGDTNAPQTEPGEEIVTYTDPRTGKQIQTTRQALQDAGIAPLEQPQQPVYTFGGRALTPAQAAALGQFATPRIPGQPGRRGTPGTLMPQNVPQGATQENPFGRQNMAPQQFMRPDNFNNPPNFFSRPQTYNPNNQNQYGNQYGNPNDNQYGGNVFGGITNQMAGTPAAGMANLASGLIGVLPGLAGGGGANIGMNLLGMLPGLMGGV